MSAHSFLYQAVGPDYSGKLGSYWPGELFINYLGFSSLEERWNANGVDRTGDYSGALLLTEIGDLATGLADAAFQSLLKDENFLTLLRAEALDTLPRIIIDGLREPRA